MDPSPPRFGFLYSEPLTISSGVRCLALSPRIHAVYVMSLWRHAQDVEEGVPYLPLANEWADIEGRLTAAGGAQTFVASATQDNLLQYLVSCRVAPVKDL